MKKQVNIYDAKAHLSRLVDEAASGIDIVIARNHKPIARLTALAAKKNGRKRRLGASNHRFVETTPRRIADAEIAGDFENTSLWPTT